MGILLEAAQRNLADAQRLSGFRTKCIRGYESRIIDFAWVSPGIKRSTLEIWQREISSIAGAQSLFFDDSDAHLTTVAVNFDEAELAPRIVEFLKEKTDVWFNECTISQPASDTLAHFTLLTTGKRFSINMMG
ncbi:hypothetical protein N7539_008599 [Penicillium diatomitis]|uniref:Uncharacterized protein n=1 Tax=Penicillium diatomitis TaxID=2819901 RepID=A0A9W9WQW0_9EURO|nr:uncharacterized protein N7539_008599 [Penicillium diatomitis]KAJ5472030.1 hypothetical protein N7539_008599 [Penicillium diatomitis]